MDIKHLAQHFPIAPTSWTSREVCLWLELLNMKEYKIEFEINKIDGLIIFDLEDSEMDALLGVKNSIHRKRIRNGINILRQFQIEMEKSKKKVSEKEAPKNFESNLNESISILSTSVINSQSSELSRLKNDKSSQFNCQTAQRRELENIFNTKALTNYENEINYHNSHTFVKTDQIIEEEKDEDNSLLILCNKQNQENNLNSSDKPFVQTLSEINNIVIPQNNLHKMNIEEDYSKKHSPKINNLNRKAPKRESLKEDLFKTSCQNNSPLSCLQDSWAHASPQNDHFESIEEQIKNLEHVERGLSQGLSTELIVQPLDGVNSANNNFFCLNANGGKIGRHSSNEIVILEESVSRYHAAIEFRENKFYLIDAGSLTGSFIKIDNPLILEENMILEMGSNQFLVKHIMIKDENNAHLILKIIEGTHMSREILVENTATIGRKGLQDSKTVVFLDDLHLSNSHTKISFTNSKFILEDLCSTNGSWLRLSPENIRSEPFELSDGMIFKIGCLSTYKVKRANTNYLKLMQPSKNLDGNTQCAICYENERDAVFMPCKHNVSCLKCSKNLNQCPVCRSKITDLIRIYKS